MILATFSEYINFLYNTLTQLFKGVMFLHTLGYVSCAAMFFTLIFVITAFDTGSRVKLKWGAKIVIFILLFFEGWGIYEARAVLF